MSDPVTGTRTGMLSTSETIIISGREWSTADEGAVERDYAAVTVDDIAERDLARALTTVAATLEPQREWPAQRQTIIDFHVSLPGRELAKQEFWQQAATDVLVDRGSAPEEDDLLAAIGFVVFCRALHFWLADPNGSRLDGVMRSALTRVRSVLHATAG